MNTLLELNGIGATRAQLTASGMMSQTKSSAYTMTEGDSGKITNIDTTCVITLPATVVGYCYTFRNTGEDGAVQITLNPDANDKIMGAGLTSADNKDLVNTLATAKKGDSITLLGDGANGWFVTAIQGTWAREG